MYYQTGDVIYLQSELPEESIKLDTIVFHHGDNHKHCVRGEFNILRHNDDLYLECLSDCELFHDEHSTIKIPQGVYKKRIVVEYDHLLEESRAVID